MRMKHKKIYADGKYVPQRMCVACREIKPQSRMIRVSLKDGEVKIDGEGKNPGRGSYVCNSIACIEKAQKTRGLERGLKAYVPAGIYEECIKVEKQ